MLVIGCFVGQIFGQTLGTILSLYFIPNPMAIAFLVMQVRLHGCAACCYLAECFSTVTEVQVAIVLCPVGKTPYLGDR